MTTEPSPDVDEAYKRLRYCDDNGRVWRAKLGGWLHDTATGEVLFLRHQAMQDLIDKENP